MNIKLKYILLILLLPQLIFSFPDCDYGDPLWEDNFVANDYEFGATIANAQVWIDGVEQQTGKLAIFYGDEVRGVDSDGAAYFPPGDTWTYEISVWSNELSGETMAFKFYDDVNDVVIVLNETYDYVYNDVAGDAWEPIILTGSSPDCDDENSNHFGDVADNTGVSELIIFSDSISNLEIGDQIGIFDMEGLISGGEECLDITGEILVGYGEWTGGQLEVVAVSHIDFCDFNGPQLPGFIEHNPIVVKIWDVSEQIEYEAILTISQGSPDFQETSFVVVLEIDSEEIYGCIDNQACNYDENANTDDGSCEYSEENYDCDGNCIVDTDCFGECGGDAIVDECDECDGDGPSHQCWDGSLVCDPFDCPDSTLPTPDLFLFNQSLSQGFYFIHNIYIDNVNVSSDDWLAAFNGDVCVGARKWDTDMCTNNVCDIGVMGYDGSDATDGYMINGDIPSFKIYDTSENVYYNAISSENFEWENSGLFTIDNIHESDYYCGNNASCSGCMDSDACNYDLDALINDDCYYLELDLLNPADNSIIIIDNLEDSLEFSWSSIDESCSDGILYQLNIFDQNFNLIVSEQTEDNSMSILFDNLNINIGEINSYAWHVSMNDIISDDNYFGIDATLLDTENIHINSFKLNQNYPNPFNPGTYISFDIPHHSFVSINIYDTKGNFLENLNETYYSSGSYTLYWDASYYSSGIYIYEMKTDSYLFRNKMMLIK